MSDVDKARLQPIRVTIPMATPEQMADHLEGAIRDFVQASALPDVLGVSFCVVRKSEVITGIAGSDRTMLEALEALSGETAAMLEHKPD